MKGPYFITTLEADVRIHPSQMNNNIMDNIKRTLEKNYSNKCYDNYGYIDKIYDVSDDIKGGIIRAEDSTSSSVHRVKFTCRICNPIKKSIIMARITGINNMIIVAENGPIRFLIGESNINSDNIQFRKSAYYPVSSKGELINKPITKGTYVMIQIMNKKIVKGKTKIIVYGRLESVMLDDEIMEKIRDQYESNEKIDGNDLINNKYEEKITSDSAGQGPEQEPESEHAEPEDPQGNDLDSDDE
jgi:DNA-directed RNA polymerase subunit E'/Rpb7